MQTVPETRYAKALDGVSIAYQVVGEGPVDVLWLDGARGNLEVLWEQPLVAGFFRKLGARCRVIRFDPRGTGLSERGVAPASLETQMEDARVVLDLVGSHRTAIVGHAWGGYLAALLASTFPKNTRALVLFGTQARGRWAPDYPWGFSDDALARDLRLIESGWGTEGGYAALEASFAAPSMLADQDYIRWVAKAQRHWVGPAAAAAFVQQFFDLDVSEALRLIQVPALIIAREWDDPEEDEYVANLIPNARLVRLPGRDWLAWVGDQDAVVDAIQGFLGAEPVKSESDTVLATVMFTDIVDSTRMAADLGDRAWREVVGRHHSTVRALLERHRGVEVDTAGDGFFATFEGPVRAVRCAQEIIVAVRPLGMEVRAGIHTGECVTIDGKMGGIAVSIGARVGASAAGSEVLVSQTVRDLVAGSGLTFHDRGEHELKGVPDRWRLYAAIDA